MVLEAKKDIQHCHFHRRKLGFVLTNRVWIVMFSEFVDQEKELQNWGWKAYYF